MSQLLNGTRSTALQLAGHAASNVRNGIGKAARVIGSVDLPALQNGSRQVLKAARRNPATTIAAVTAAMGAGIALWLLRRRGQEATAGHRRPVEIEPVRMQAKSRRPASRRPAAKPHGAR
ncbi:MAG TPA: hypothetical protein VGH80_03010 [Xanthomonadaceae bacterium]|jgi:hypothetical protein